MSRIYLHGWGAVSPAGWSARALSEAVAKGEPIPPQPLPRPGRTEPLRVRKVPVPTTRPAFLAHPRLRRTSPISQYALGATLEALGPDEAKVKAGELRLGLIYCAFTGCVNYSRRFYEEVLRDPATASPIVFPETVFNAPASHLAAFLGTPAVNYTLVGDEGEFVKGLALASEWLLAGTVDGCLVVGAEETDWLSAGALELLSPSAVPGEGAGAVYLRREPGPVELVAITEPVLFSDADSRACACDNTYAQWSQVARAGAAVISNRLPAPSASSSPTAIVGEGLAATGAWQTVLAAETLTQGGCTEAVVETVGGNEQVVAAVLRRP